MVQLSKQVNTTYLSVFCMIRGYQFRYFIQMYIKIKLTIPFTKGPETNDFPSREMTVLEKNVLVLVLL